MRKSYIAFVLAAGTFFHSTAQQPDMRAEINVDRTVVPVQRVATPLASSSPIVLVPEIETYSLSLTDYSTPSEYDNTIRPLLASPFPGLKGQTPYRGYLSIGYFPLFNAGVSAGYRILETQNTSLGVWMQYDGYNYHAHGPFARKADGTLQSVRDNTVTLGADFSQRLGKRNRLTASLNYTYGSQIQPYLSGVAENNGFDHTISGFNGKLAYYGGVNKLGWHIGGEFDHLSEGKFVPVMGQNVYGDAAGASENRVFAHAGAVWQMSRRANLGLEVSVDFLHRCRGLLLRDMDNDILNVGSPEKSTLSIIKAQPYFAFHRGKVNARLGLDVNIATVTVGSHVHFNPNILLEWNPLSKFAVYARFEGGDSFNSLRSLYSALGSFAVGNYVYTPSTSPVKSRFGFNFGPFKGLSVELYGRYADTHNAPMPAILENVSGAVGTFVQTDMSGWGAGASVTYSWRDRLNAHASFEYAASGYASGFSENFDRAKTITNIGADFNVTPKLLVGINYELRAGRNFYRFTCVDSDRFIRQRESLRNISNLDLNANYRLTDAFSVFVRVENLLCCRAETLPWIAAPSIHGLFGASLKF